MQTLSENEIVSRISRQEPFTAVIDSGAFSIKIDRYIPLICTAIHAGSTLHEPLVDKILLGAEERRYEEDPFTGDMLASFPIVLQAFDSRYQYDLNRPPGECIYEEAWGKKVWNEPLTPEERSNTLSLHESYYRVLHALLQVLEENFSRCIVYDLHSYNYKRMNTAAPLFNIGTHFIDQTVYRPVLEHLHHLILTAKLPKIETEIAFDEVFTGRGYQAFFIHKNHRQSLCIPFEIKKVYMDETTGELYPHILEAITESLEQVFSANGSYFTRRFAQTEVKRCSKRSLIERSS